MNKKSVIVLAVLLFIGLGTFVFANPDTEELKNEDESVYKSTDNNTTKVENKDNNLNENNGSVNNEVIKPDNNTLDDGTINNSNGSNSSGISNGINNNDNIYNGSTNNSNSGSSNTSDITNDNNYDNIKNQVANLLNLVKNARSKSDIDEARIYLNNNRIIDTVANIKDISIKNKLTNDINSISAILNDIEAPKIEGIINNAYTKDNVSITIMEDNIKEIILNNKKVGLTDLTNINEEGNYTLIVRDNSFNEDKIVFTIDRTSPVLKVYLSKSELTNQDVIVTISSNEPIKLEDSFWTLSNDLKSMSKAFGENASGLVTVSDLAGNIASIPYEITNIDKSPLEGEIQLSIIEPTKNNVRVFIFTNKDVLEPEGWKYLNKNTKRILYRDFKENTSLSEVTVNDIAGNSLTLSYEVNNIDRISPEILGLDISTLELTDQNVVYKIMFNEPIKDNVVGWTLEGKNTLVREFAVNSSGSIIVEDLAGNTSKVDFEVNNIDKLLLETEITYNVIEPTNNDVRAIISANKEIREINGWKYLDADKTKLYKDLSNNTSEVVAVSDNLGHISLVNCQISNIDKEAPILNVSYTLDYLDKNKVIIVVSANEELKLSKELEEAGWILSTTKNSIFKNSKVGDKGTIKVNDLASNEASIDYLVKEVLEEPFKTEVFISNSNYTNQDVTVTIKTERPIYEFEGEVVTDEATIIKGWIISNNRQELTKVYSEKAYKQYIVLKDEEGNVAVPRFEITNVDKNIPEVSSDNVSYNKLADNKIEVIIKVSKEIYTPDGWTNIENYRKFKKVFAKDTTQMVKLADLYGNVGYINIDTRNVS